SISLAEVFNNVLKEMSERIFRFNNPKVHKFVLACILNHVSTENPVVILRKERDARPMLIYIDLVVSFTELENWINSNRMRRHYNMNDNRHIENSPFYI